MNLNTRKLSRDPFDMNSSIIIRGIAVKNK